MNSKTNVPKPPLNATRRLRFRAAFCPFVFPKSVSRSNSSPTKICMRTTQSVRKTSAKPSLAAALAAVLITLPVVLPMRTRLTDRSRRILPAAAASTLAMSVLLRPRTILSVHPVDDDESDFDAARPSTSIDDDEQLQPNLNDTLDAASNPHSSPSSLFQTSRQEWDTPPPSKSSTSEAVKQDVSSDPLQSTPSASSSTVYSYSFASSRKRRKTPPETNAHSSTKPTSSDSYSQETGKKTGMDEKGSSVFERMRSEFEQEETVSPNINPKTQNFDKTESTFSPQRRRSYSESSTPIAPPQPITTSNLVSKVMHLPVHVLSEVILPLIHIVSLVWYDWKVSILDQPSAADKNSIDALFLPPLKSRQTQTSSSRVDAQDEFRDDYEYYEHPDAQLSEEEKQIEQVRQVTEKTVKNVTGAFRKIMGEFF